MNILLHGSACVDQFLVDVGELIPVAAVNAQSAYHMVTAGLYGPGQQCPPEHPMVYQM